MTVANPCLSGGAIEIFLEPSPPRAARARRRRHADRRGASCASAPSSGSTWSAADGDGLEPRPGDLALVVAAHGRDELRRCARGLEAGLPYVGLVASAKRGDGVLGELRGDGVAEELLDADRRARRARDRRAHARRDRALDPREGGRAPRRDRERAPRAGDGRRSGLRDDGRRGPEHAVARARGRDLYFCSEGCKASSRRAQHAVAG